MSRDGQTRSDFSVLKIPVFLRDIPGPCSRLSGLPNAHAKSQRFGNAISQIAPLPPGGSSKSQFSIADRS